MWARIIVTAAMLLLAVGAFWGNALGVGRLFNPFGILFLLLAALVWRKWEMLREAFWAAKNESPLPVDRLGYNALVGLKNLMGPRQERRSSS